MKRAARLIAGMALALAPAMAHAADAACLSTGEFTALATYALPDVIAGTAQRCSASLPPHAFLRDNGASLAQRYASARTTAWPGARAAFLKIAAPSEGDAAQLMQTLPDANLQQMLDALVSGIVARNVPVDRCDALDLMIHAVSPLPPQSTAEVIGLAVGLGSRTGRGKLGPITLCPDQRLP